MMAMIWKIPIQIAHAMMHHTIVSTTISPPVTFHRFASLSLEQGLSSTSCFSGRLSLAGNTPCYAFTSRKITSTMESTTDRTINIRLTKLNVF